jgi:hypothetical protein
MNRPNRASLLSPEWRLILACSRSRLRDSDRRQIGTLLSGPLDWARLTAAASQHSVEPLLLHHLTGEFAGTLPPNALAHLQEIARLKRRRSLLLARQLVELVKAFESAELLTVPYKGPTLASLAYGNLALRSSEDLDFAMRHQDLPRAFDVLVAAGYRAGLDRAVARDAHFLDRGNPGQYCFFSPTEFMVELHTERTLRYFPVPLDWKVLGRRLRTVFVGGCQVRTFSVEDTLVLLAVHGTKHFWDRLGWICDIAELVQIEYSLDWDLSESLASGLGCRRMWLLALALARDVLGTPLPTPILGRISDERSVAALIGDVRGRLSSPTVVARSASERLRFRLRSHQSLLQGMRQCLRTATWATEDDLRAYALPEWATPLYAVLRPWRLLRAHGLGWRTKGVPR